MNMIRNKNWFPAFNTAAAVIFSIVWEYFRFQVPGSRTEEIFAKLEIYLWLGIMKYVKNSTAELPEEFKPVYDQVQQSMRIPTYLPPSQLNRDGELND